jgi:UDP-N-acetylmuramoylalanine--D-glutamate ligase
MESKAERFFKSLAGKKVAFCGMGRSNLPVLHMFAQRGAVLTACDKRNRDQLGALADDLESAGATLQLGEGYLDHLDAEIVFRTPGLPYSHPGLVSARENGAAVTSEMEAFFDLCPCKIYAVTGSDGKTTTATIIAEMLRAAGKTVYLGGNIGEPLLPKVLDIRPEDAAVVELSSFQLISMRRSPDVAVVTNVSPNHLDWHRDMEEYIEAKKNIILHQNAFGRAVLNIDNEITDSFAELTRGKTCFFSRKQSVELGAWLSEDGAVIMVENGRRETVMHKKDIRLPGLHNVENYLAAISAVWGDVPAESIRRVAGEFGGVEHRAELVRELRHVRYYNDSIASSPTRTAKGMLSLFDQKIILIAGGYDKKIPFGEFGPVVVEKVKTLILLGATADKIEEAVRSTQAYRPGCPQIVRASTMEEAVAAAARLAVEGDIVALSPACASFDLYPNFEARGRHFKALVNALE